MTAYTVVVKKRVVPKCKHETARWKIIKVMENFFSAPDEFMLNVAKAVGDKKWVDREKRRWAGCSSAGGTLTYRVVSGAPSSRAYCIDAPDRHKAVGITGVVTHHKVYL